MSNLTIPEPVRRWLRDALPDWQQRGLINPDQAHDILALYENDADAGLRGRSLVSFALLSLGAFLLFLAALLLIGFNWQAIPREAKLALAWAVIAATHAAAFWVRRTSPAIGEALFFLGCLFYGAGIWLIAQAFHLDAHYPDGVLWWAIGVLPFALVLDSMLLHVLFVGLMALWAGMEVIGFMHLPPWWLFGWDVLPNGAWILPLLAAPGLVWAYRKNNPNAVGLYIGLLSWWVVLQAFAWRFGLSPLSVFWVGGVGAILLLLAEAHRPGDPMALPYRGWGTLLAAGALIPMSSWWFWTGGAQSYRWAGPETDVMVRMTAPMIAFALLAVAAGLVVVRLNAEGFGRIRVPGALFLVTMALAYWVILIPDDASAGLVPTVLANAAMIGLAIYLIHVGAREERLQSFAAGVIYFLVWAIGRYMDLFSAAGGMLGAAAIFALCGLAMFAIARFWSSLKPQPDEDAPPAPAPTPWQGPEWVTRAADWVRDRYRPVLYTAVGFQLAFLVAMIAAESVPLMTGDTISLRVRPVDPRDVFRGDYVVLNYDINQMNPTGAGGWGRPVYVTLEPEADGKHWRGVSASHTRPAGGKYLLGREGMSGRGPLEFGIEAYYVQEGEGLKWEDAARKGKLTAEVVVSPWGKAKLKRLRIDE